MWAPVVVLDCVRVYQCLTGHRLPLPDEQGQFLKANEDYIVAHNLRRLRREAGIRTARSQDRSVMEVGDPQTPRR